MLIIPRETLHAALDSINEDSYIEDDEKVESTKPIVISNQLSKNLEIQEEVKGTDQEVVISRTSSSATTTSSSSIVPGYSSRSRIIKPYSDSLAYLLVECLINF